MKDKPDQIRVYDVEGYRLRAASVCVKDESLKDVLLVSAGREKGYFIIPGGGINPGEMAYDASKREAREEGGVNGRIIRPLGIFKNEKNKTKTHVYLVVVDEMDEEWMEKSMGRTRRWFTSVEALKHLQENRQEQFYLSLSWFLPAQQRKMFNRSNRKF